MVLRKHAERNVLVFRKRLEDLEIPVQTPTQQLAVSLPRVRRDICELNRWGVELEPIDSDCETVAVGGLDEGGVGLHAQ